MELQDLDDADGRKRVEVKWSGTATKHGYTDIVCLLLFIAFLGAWGFVGTYAIIQGDIDTVLYPSDTEGRVCGSGSMANKKFLLYFDLTRCLNPAVLAIGCNTPQVCVEECPKEALTIYTNKAKIEKYCSPPANDTTDEWKDMEPYDLVKNDICPSWVLPSDPFLGRCIPHPADVDLSNGTDTKTISSGTINNAISMLGAVLNVREFFSRIAMDLQDTWWMILLALTSATVVCFLWIVLMRFLTGIMVWTSIALILIVVGTGLVYSLYRFILVMDVFDGPQNIFQVNYTPMFFHDVLELRDTWLSFSIILGVILFILGCLFLALRERINIAIKMIEHGSKAVSHMLCSLLFPVIPFILHCIVIIWFVVAGMYMASIRVKKFTVYYDEDEVDTFQSLRSSFWSIETHRAAIRNQIVEPQCPLATETLGNCTYLIGDECFPKTFNETVCSQCDPHILCKFDEFTKPEGLIIWLQWFNLFGFYWAMNFVTSYGEMVLAGVFAKWYWTRDKSKIPCSTLCTSIFNATVYHLGTIAFGSLIIAIIKLIRAIVSYIEARLKKVKQNDLVRCMFCMCKCCLWMLEKFMKFINRNAYIICAIKSTNFCTSSREAFKLILKNPVRAYVLNKMVDFLLFVGKVVIVALAGVLSYLVFHGWLPDIGGDIPTLNFFFTPLIFITIGTYFIASSFFGVYAMAVDTIFLSFLQDLKQNDGSLEKPYMMDKSLQETVGVMQKFRQEELNHLNEQLEAEIKENSGQLLAFKNTPTNVQPENFNLNNERWND